MVCQHARLEIRAVAAHCDTASSLAVLAAITLPTNTLVLNGYRPALLNAGIMITPVDVMTELKMIQRKVN